jgi:hypothetical protein
MQATRLRRSPRSLSRTLEGRTHQGVRPSTQFENATPRGSAPRLRRVLGDVASFGFAVADDPLRAVESYVTLCGVFGEVWRLRSAARLSCPTARPDVGVGCQHCARRCAVCPGRSMRSRSAHIRERSSLRGTIPSGRYRSATWWRSTTAAHTAENGDPETKAVQRRRPCDTHRSESVEPVSRGDPDKR